MVFINPKTRRRYSASRFAVGSSIKFSLPPQSLVNTGLNGIQNCVLCSFLLLFPREKARSFNHARSHLCVFADPAALFDLSDYVCFDLQFGDCAECFAIQTFSESCNFLLQFLVFSLECYHLLMHIAHLIVHSHIKDSPPWIRHSNLLFLCPIQFLTHCRILIEEASG